MLLHPELVLAEAENRRRELIAEAERRRYRADAAARAGGRLRGRRGRHRSKGGAN